MGAEPGDGVRCEAGDGEGVRREKREVGEIVRVWGHWGGDLSLSPVASKVSEPQSAGSGENIILRTGQKSLSHLSCLFLRDELSNKVVFFFELCPQSLSLGLVQHDVLPCHKTHTHTHTHTTHTDRQQL